MSAGTFAPTAHGQRKHQSPGWNKLGTLHHIMSCAAEMTDCIQWDFCQYDGSRICLHVYLNVSLVR